jgi:hypothetical protein
VRARQVGLVTALLVAAGVSGATSAGAAAGPPNDEIANATRIPGLPYDDATDLSGAAADDPDDPAPCFPAHHTVWYRFTPAVTRDVAADSFGSDIDTTLAVFTGPPATPSLVACNDDTNTSQSRVVFRGRAGVRYWIRLGSYYAGFAGPAVLHVRGLPPPLRLTVAVRSTGTVTAAGRAAVGGSVTCSAPTPVTVVGSLRQGRAVGYYRADVACSGRAGWTARTAGETAGFRPGDARAAVTALAVDAGRDQLVRVRTERGVRLARG